MKRRHLLQAAAGMPLAGLSLHAGADLRPAAPGERVHWPADLTLLDGSPWAARPGVATVVVFWSTTCPFCKRHNVHVEKLHRSIAGSRVAVLGVARDRDPAVVQRHLAATGLSFPVTMAYKPLAAALSTRNVIPLTITVDRDGRLRQVIPGEMFEEDVLELARLAE